VRLGQLPESTSLDDLGSTRLDDPHGLQRLLQVGRQFPTGMEHPEPAAAQLGAQPRPQPEHRWQRQQGHQGELPAQEEKQPDEREHLNGGEDGLGDVRRHQHAQLVDVRGQADDRLAGACAGKERQIEAQKVLVKVASDVPRDPSLDDRQRVLMHVPEDVLREEHEEHEQDDVAQCRHGRGAIDPTRYGSADGPAQRPAWPGQRPERRRRRALEQDLEEGD